jgi:transcription termination factor Rho
MSDRVTGILEIANRPDGRLRQLDETYHGSDDDPVVPKQLMEKLGLRSGVELEVTLGKPMGGGGSKKKKKSKWGSISPDALRVKTVHQVQGLDPDVWANQTRRFDELTVIDPQPRLTLEYDGAPPACRLIDVFCPIGYGTRGMIVSPPKAGKTTLLQNIAFAVQNNHPDVKVVALLVDERPEEVTDFRRNVPCTVWASSNDHPPERHCGLAILAIDRAKRWAEAGQDVLILCDSLTRIGRAFNVVPQLHNVGRTLSGGLDAGALALPKQMFGAARKFQEGGSLTIVASALVDTGSRGDQVIFEEFKGTGNMELILDRRIAEKRIFPAIDLAASGTRKEEKLMSDKEVETINALRRRLLQMPPEQQMAQLLKALERFPTNADLVGSPQSPGAQRATAGASA